MKCKRLLLLLLALCLVVPAAAMDAPTLGGAQGALYCVETGQLLFDKDANAQVAPASVTKLMTALLVLENCPDLVKEITVSDEAVNSVEYNSTHIALTGGEVVTIEQMMYALLMQSANDAANVLAEEVGGSMEDFAVMMNRRAEELGCRNTHFVNANGLDAEGHYTSAYDLALIMAELLNHPAFEKISDTMNYEIPPTNKQVETRYFACKQQLLKKNSKYYYEGAVAGKNGWTSRAHSTLVTAARRDGVTLVAVTLGSEGAGIKETDTISMFDYGYQNFARHELTAADFDLPQDAFDGETVCALLPKDATAELSYEEKDGVYCLSAQWDGNIHTLGQIEPCAATAVAEAEKPLPAERPASAWWWIGVAFILVGLTATVYISYRMHRIRKQRRRIRAMRARNDRQ